jgi:hypothetical protein
MSKNLDEDHKKIYKKKYIGIVSAVWIVLDYIL